MSRANQPTGQLLIWIGLGLLIITLVMLGKADKPERSKGNVYESR